MSSDATNLSAPAAVTVLRATSAQSDEEIVRSWLASLGSDHTRRNFEVTARRLIAALDRPLRQATVEDVRQAIETITVGASASTARQYILRAKSLLSYAHELGYLPFNAGVAIKPPKEVRALAKRIVDELDVRDLIRSTRSQRDRVLLAVTYAAGLRVSEIVALDVGDVLKRQDGRVQLHIVGKGGKERTVLLPATLGPMLLQFVDGRSHTEPLFVSRKAGGRLTERAVNHLVKRLATEAGINPKLSAHWLRHAHASHSLDRGAPLSLVAGTLGHANVSTTSAYLHAKPGAASGDNLDPKVWEAK